VANCLSKNCLWKFLVEFHLTFLQSFSGYVCLPVSIFLQSCLGVLSFCKAKEVSKSWLFYALLATGCWISIAVLSFKFPREDKSKILLFTWIVWIPQNLSPHHFGAWKIARLFWISQQSVISEFPVPASLQKLVKRDKTHTRHGSSQWKAQSLETYLC